MQGIMKPFAARRSRQSVPKVFGAGIIFALGMVSLVSVAKFIKWAAQDEPFAQSSSRRRMEGVLGNEPRCGLYTNASTGLTTPYLATTAQTADMNKYLAQDRTNVTLLQLQEKLENVTFLSPCVGNYSKATHFLSTASSARGDATYYSTNDCDCVPVDACVGKGVHFYIRTFEDDEGLGYTPEYNTCGCDPWRDAGAGQTIWRILAILYLFFGIAIVCDDYFTASLEVLSIKFKLSEDVAGATFMAAGSSAPELFTSLAAVFSEPTSECPGATGAESVGVGTIVGSAIFNILIIIGVTALLAGNVLQLQWKPLVRDACFYALSIGLMMIFIHDGAVYWYEGLVLILGYVSYIVFMKFNTKLLGDMGTDIVVDEDVAERTRRHSVPDDDETTTLSTDVEKNGANDDGAEKKEEKKEEGGEEEEEEEVSFCLGCPMPEAPESLYDKVCLYFTIPWYFIFTLTVPNCEEGKGWEKWYLVTFVMSIGWIGAICHFMVEFSVELGEINGISKAVMGLTVLSAGTSVPDALSSILVAKRGLGDMAVSNALGSNVFDILLGLGLPYLISNLIRIGDSDRPNECTQGKGQPHELTARMLPEGVPYFSGPKPVPVCMCVNDVRVYIVALSTVLIVVIGTFMAFKFRLHPALGGVFLATYFVFALLMILRDQDVFDMGLKCS